jgi:hypothetical protein
VPSIERVDVVELERSVLHAAQVSAPVNQNVLANPKVHITINDAREVLLTTPQRYDVIFSEPSNPFRAGVASLFTREFYEAAGQRLRPGGIFLQWLQAYEVDAQTVRTVYGTIASVFPWVETYQTMAGDLLLVASSTPIAYDVPALRAEYDPARRARVQALVAFAAGDFETAREAWFLQTREPEGPAELSLVATGLAEAGDERALPYIERLRAYQPIEADVAMTLLRWAQHRIPEAATSLEAAFRAYHDDPWPLPQIMRQMTALAFGVASADRAAGERLLQQLKRPFAVAMLEDRRVRDALVVAELVGFDRYCRELLSQWEPWVPWARDALAARVRCYEATGDPRAELARQELKRYLAQEPIPLAAGLS